jgi:outer membrane protein TolC
MRTIAIPACLAAVLVSGAGITTSVSAQQLPAAALAGARPLLQQQQAPPARADATQVRRITADEAVRLALENNLGIQVARINPQIEDLSVAQARAAWAPNFATTVQQNGVGTPNSSFLTGAQGSKLTTNRLNSNVGVDQALPWGGSYSIGWDNSRTTTTNLFANFSPQVQSSLSLNYTQPLLRGFNIDFTRQQLLISQKNREVADVQLRQSVTSTNRAVRNAYWELAYAIASLQVQQQSLDLANESLRNTRARVEIGTTPPIDIVEAEAEVAQREESVILGQSSIDTAQDTLRSLIFNTNDPNFWNVRIEPSELPKVTPVTVDTDAVVRNALDRRTDLEQTRKTLESDEISIRFARNQTLPDVTASIDYGLTGLGGTRLIRDSSGLFGGAVIGQTVRSFGSVLADIFGNDFPNWTASLNIRYPIGTSQAEANLARARLQYQQAQTQLRNQQLQVSLQVRDAARQVQTNQKRMNTTRASRELAERRLEAEQRKFAAGTSTNFLVFQAQRDLAQAQNNELRALLDYQRSLVDLETVQEVPLTGGAASGSTTTVVATGGATTSNTGAVNVNTGTGGNFNVAGGAQR